MAWYRTGTVTVTNGSTTVTGASTAWVANVGIGEGLLAPDGRIYEITEVVSNTSLKISPAYLGATQSAQAYTIVPTQSYIRDLAAQAADLVNRYDFSNWGQDFGKATNTSQALQKLGLDNLGTAATKNVGVSSGNVMEVGAFGLGGQGGFQNPDDIAYGGFHTSNQTSEEPLLNMPGVCVLTIPRTGGDGRAVQVFSRAVGSDSSVHHPLCFRSTTGAPLDWGEVAYLLDTKTTTVDGSGFIKEASPTINLYDARIEAKGFGSETPVLEKIGIGEYKITGTSGLAQKGWYIETPQDRNGNKYFNVDWEQDVTPVVDENGMVDESANVTLTVRTYERVWNPQTGTHDNGAPVDITERYVSMRFVEVRQPEEEPEGGGDVA